MPSASSVAAPMIAGTYAFLPNLRTRANRENIPPSPLLSACKVRIMYLNVVCKVRVQNTQEIPPYTNKFEMGRSPIIALKTYRGEVPISPYIIPNATNKVAVVTLEKLPWPLVEKAVSELGIVG